MSQRLSWSSIPLLVREVWREAEVGEHELEEVQRLEQRVEDERGVDAFLAERR